ncbi:MAG: T9SS type A sorting domain-containing protein, partial [Bacteroidetes bacterium]|nr:T9SS type A sorting domain-containing protein [Bacteroidota bacterium]
IFSKYGYNRETRKIKLSNGVLHIENVALSPAAQTSLSIEVIEEGSNLPIADAKIELSAHEGSETLLQTDQQGMASENILTGGYFLSVGKWGYKTVAQSIAVTDTTGTIIIALKKGYYDDFTFNFNWVGAASAISGNWVRGVPFGTFSSGYLFNPDFDSRKDFGNKAFVTGNTPDTDVSLDEVQGGKTTLYSPIFDLSGYVDPVISFEYWLTKINNNGGDANDTLIVKFIAGNQEYIIGKYTKSLPIWKDVQFRVLDYHHSLTNTNLLIFEIEDKAPFGVLEAGVDHFEVIETGWAVNIEDELPEVDFQIYPVPVEDHFQVSYHLNARKSLGELTFEVIDLQGRNLWQQTLNGWSGKQEISLDLPAGMYIGNLRLDGRLLKSVKWMKASY